MKTSKFLALTATTIAASLISTCVLAKQVPLFAEPQEKAKVIGTIDLAAGIIPIFTPKDSAWVKVADPRNGNVGWVKAAELIGHGASSFSFSTRFLSDDGSPERSYQIIKFGDGKQTTKEMDAQLKKLQAQQEVLQKTVNQSIRNMVNDMNQLYQQYWNTMNEVGIPVIMPVMLVPAKEMTNETTKPVKLVPPAQSKSE